MKSLFTVSALAATALLTSICGSAEAINIVITNPSFETDATSGPDTNTVTAPTGFTGSGALVGTFEPGSGAYTGGIPAIPNGSKVAFLQPGGSLTQTFTDIFLADKQYTFTAFVGNRSDQSGTFTYSIEILANGSSIATATTPIPANGLFASSTVTFDTALNSAFNDQNIGIKLTNTGTEQVTFDDLSLIEVPFDFSPNLAIGVLGAAWAAKKFLTKKAA